MNKEQMQFYARQGIKMTHNCFSEEEYLTMKNNMTHFEDGVKMFFDDWAENKSYLEDGWSMFPQKEVPDGTYTGVQGGYIFEITHENTLYKFGTKEGLRCMGCPATYTIKNGLIVEK